MLKYQIFLLIYQDLGMSKTKLLNIRIDPDLKKRGDRNLYVDYIEINDVRLEPEEAVYDRGWDEISGRSGMY